MTKLTKRDHEERTVYDHVVRLLSGHALHEGVLLDLGCGFGAVAASCAELGLDYLGVGAGPDGLEEIARQGFSTALVDLSETAALVERLEEVLAGRQLAAITALDLIERLAHPAELLTALADMANRHTGAPLVVSVANVSHFDVAAKLLSGRWDVTPAGLLDEHHLSLFAPGGLEEELSRAGWKEIKADDFVVRPERPALPRDPDGTFGGYTSARLPVGGARAERARRARQPVRAGLPARGPVPADRRPIPGLIGYRPRSPLRPS